MPVQNAEIADIFNQYADLLEVQGANQFRVRAYRTAARTASGLSRSLSDLVRQETDLAELPGIGKELAAKIVEIVRTGKLRKLEELKEEVPAGLIDIMGIAGLGPRKAAVLYNDLGITSIAELEQAARDGKVRELPGFAARTEEKILEEIGRKGAAGEKRFKLFVVHEIAQPLLAYLKETPGVAQVEAAGSYRRGRETVGDLDILVTIRENSDVMERFVTYEDVDHVVSRGPTRSTVIFRNGLQVDVRAVPEESYGSALQYFTGSKAHNVAIRQIGVRKGLKINEYGVFKDDERIAGRTEEDVYKQVGLPYIEPELREDRSEIEAARDGKLPELVTLGDIRGDLHSHSNATDGKASLEEMARAARDKGYEYLAISDHSKRLAMAHGLDEKRLGEQIKEIDRLNGRLTDFTLLKGIEVDILEDGSLDLSNDILRELDLVVCSLHYKFNLSLEQQTGRVLRALETSPVFTILGHPTGRLIDERQPYDIDLERIMKAAAARGHALELNAQPERLDLEDIYCQMAKELGVRIAVSTDAHSTGGLDLMPYGIFQARRGWLEADDILNTRSLSALLNILRRS